MIKIEENKSIREFNTIGVSAKTFKYCKISDIKSLLYILKSNSLPLKILGGGSNILWTNDFLGLTLHINIKGIFIGGCDIIKDMFEKGELKKILEEKKLI